MFLAPFCMEREVERDRLRFQTDWVVRSLQFVCRDVMISTVEVWATECSRDGTQGRRHVFTIGGASQWCSLRTLPKAVHRGA